MPASTHPRKSISPIPRDPESHIWATYGPNKSPKTTKDTLATVALFLVGSGWLKSYFGCLNSYLYQPQLISPSLLLQRSLSQTSDNHMALIMALKQSKISLLQLHFLWHSSGLITMCVDRKTATCQRSKYCPPLALMCSWVMYCDFWGEFLGS